MPRLTPPDRISGYHSNNQLGVRPSLTEQKKAITGKNDRASAIRQEVDRIETKHWHNRLSAYCKKKIKRLIHPPPSIKLQELITRLTEKSSEKDPQKVIAALKLHAGKGTQLYQLDNGSSSFIDGEIAINTDTVEAIEKSAELNGVEMAYEYIRKGKNLPAGYLKKILFPYLTLQVTEAVKELKANNTQLSRTQFTAQHPKKYKKLIEQLAVKVSLVDEQSFSFERMLELKKEIRNTIVKSVEEQKSQRIKNPLKQSKTDPDQLHFFSPKLDTPKKTNHFIEKEDSVHIQKITSQERFFSKVHLKDLSNRVKRIFLRNKRNHILIGLAVIVGTIIAAIIPPAGISIGIAIAVSLATDIGYIIFWTEGTALWRKTRLIRGLKQIRKYADFDYTSLDKQDDKKRKALIKKLLYRCKHKTFTQIYNASAELEKQEERLKEIAKKPQKTLADSIAFEKEKALYQERYRKLKSNLFFFDLLRENIIVSRVILENRYINDLKVLWQEKFARMPAKDRAALFKNVSRDKELIIRGKQIKTKNRNWMNDIIPWLPPSPGNSNRSANYVLENTDFKSLEIMKRLTQGFFLNQVKKTLFSNLTNLFKLTGKRLHSVPIKPVPPNVTLEGSLCFVAFFFLEIANSHINNKQNKARMKEIAAGKKGFTRQLFHKRKRTDREEIATLRSNAKEAVEPMVDLLLDSIKDMEKIGEILDNAKIKSKNLGMNKFSAMSDKDGAKCILKHAAMNQELAHEIDGSFNQFYKLVHKKASNWNQQLTHTLIANGKQTISVSTLPRENTHNFISYLKGKKKVHYSQSVISTDIIKRQPSEIFLHRIKNRISGQLIQDFLKGKLLDNQAIRKIHSLPNLDELRVFQIWINYALAEESYKKHKATLKKFDRIVAHVIHQRDISFRGT